MLQCVAVCAVVCCRVLQSGVAVAGKTCEKSALYS